MKIYSRRKKKRSWLLKIKDILDKTGFSFVWNKGRGPTDINTNWENEIKILLENQMIQKWSEETKKNQKH